MQMHIAECAKCKNVLKALGINQYVYNIRFVISHQLIEAYKHSPLNG